MKIIYSRENLTDALFDEAMELLVDNNAATGHLGSDLFKIDRDVYLRINDSGGIRVCVAREAGIDGADPSKGRMVGYCLDFVSEHPHYKGVLHSTQDALFMREDDRSGIDGLRLIRFADAKLIEDGVKCIIRQSIDRHDTSKLYEKLGYSKFQTTWVSSCVGNGTEVNHGY